jgi:hypothetical protein
LKYIEDIETFLFVINSNKKEILEKYEELKSDPIKMAASLKLVKYNINNTKKIEINTTKSKNSQSSEDESN